MPVQITPATLRELIRPGMAVRKESDCHVNVSPDRIQLQVQSEGKTVHLNHAFPTAPLDPQFERETRSFWLPLERIKDFLDTGVSEAVLITFPFETPDSKMILQSAGLTYRFSPRDPAYRVFDGESTNHNTTASLDHGPFNLAVQVANLVGDEMHVHLDPATRTVAFSAENTDGHAFSYVLPAEHITSMHGAESSLTISIDRLRAITPLIPATTLASVQLTPHRLTYQVEHPTESAELVLHIAQRHGTIQK